MPTLLEVSSAARSTNAQGVTAEKSTAGCLNY